MKKKKYCQCRYWKIHSSEYKFVCGSHEWFMASFSWFIFDHLSEYKSDHQMFDTTFRFTSIWAFNNFQSNAYYVQHIYLLFLCNFSIFLPASWMHVSHPAQARVFFYSLVVYWLWHLCENLNESKPNNLTFIIIVQMKLIGTFYCYKRLYSLDAHRIQWPFFSIHSRVEQKRKK